MAAHRMKISGAARKKSQLKPVTSALMKVRTLTTESCALAYQPSHTSVNSRKSAPHPDIEAGPLHQHVLEEEDHRQKEESRGVMPMDDGLRPPDRYPERLGLVDRAGQPAVRALPMPVAMPRAAPVRLPRAVRA